MSGPFSSSTSFTSIPHRVGIVTDSSSDILSLYAQSLGVMVVPNRIIFGTQTFYDGYTITPGQFFRMLEQSRDLPRSEPATPNDFYHAYRTMFEQGYTDLVSIHVSSNLSYILQNAQAAKNHLPSASIEIIDSLQAGIGMWPVVSAAAQIANSGATVAEVCEGVRSMLARIHVFFLVESLEYLRRNGRIGRAQALLGSVADAHPILTLQDGVITPVKTVRPRERALVALRELALSQGDVELMVISTSSPEFMSEIENLMQTQYSGRLLRTWLGPTIGANMGPAIGVVVVVR